MPCCCALAIRSSLIACRSICTFVIISPTDKAVLSSPSAPSNGISVEMSKEPSKMVVNTSKSA